MKDLKIIRKNIVANTIEHFAFDVDGFRFSVKNFNDFDIYVAFESTSDTDKMIKVPPESCQVCFLNECMDLNYSSRDVYVYAVNSGEVEVQCILY